MRRAAAEQVKAVRGLIDPDNEESPLGRYRSEIVKSVRDETAKVHKAVQELTTQLAVDEAKAEMFELTTKKGFTFEDELEHDADRDLPAARRRRRAGRRHAGCARQEGRLHGHPQPRGHRRPGRLLRPSRRRTSSSTCATCCGSSTQAIANRGALAGIAVFAKDEQCPGDAPFQPYGNRALVVYDPTDGDDLALRLACCWARWVARRQLAAGGDTVDLDRVGSLIEDARQALRTRSTIDRALTTSANKITEAKNHLGTLVAEVEAALAAIEGEIAA